MRNPARDDRVEDGDWTAVHKVATEMGPPWIPVRNGDRGAAHAPDTALLPPYALLHPDHGVALLGRGPDPEAVTRFRAILAETGFSTVFGGFPPTVYRPLPPPELSLAEVIENAFVLEPGVMLSDGTGEPWAQAVRRILAKSAPVRASDVPSDNGIAAASSAAGERVSTASAHDLAGPRAEQPAIVTRARPDAEEPLATTARVPAEPAEPPAVVPATEAARAPWFRSRAPALFMASALLTAAAGATVWYLADQRGDRRENDEIRTSSGQITPAALPRVPDHEAAPERPAADGTAAQESATAAIAPASGLLLAADADAHRAPPAPEAAAASTGATGQAPSDPALARADAAEPSPATSPAAMYSAAPTPSADPVRPPDIAGSQAAPPQPNEEPAGSALIRSAIPQDGQSAAAPSLIHDTPPTAEAAPEPTRNSPKVGENAELGSGGDPVQLRPAVSVAVDGSGSSATAQQRRHDIVADTGAPTATERRNAVARPALSGGALSPEMQEALLRRGNAMFAAGDISAARKLFERAAASGVAAAATAAGKTYDPDVLAGIRALGIRPDPAAAAEWYRKAKILGDPEAAGLLRKFEAAERG